MNVLEFARKYNRIIEDYPCIPVLYHIAKPWEANDMISVILLASEYDVSFDNKKHVTLMKFSELSDEYYPIKCSGFYKNNGFHLAKFRQLTSHHREYEYFYGICYSDTIMYIALIPTDENKLKKFGVEWGVSNHKGSDGLNVDISKYQLRLIMEKYGYRTITHKETDEMSL